MYNTRHFLVKSELHYLDDIVLSLWVNDNYYTDFEKVDAAHVESAKKYMKLIEANKAIFSDFDFEKWYYNATHTYGGASVNPRTWQSSAYNLFYDVVNSYFGEKHDLCVGNQLLHEGKETYFNRTFFDTDENHQVLIDMFKDNFKYSEDFMYGESDFAKKDVKIYLNEYCYDATVSWSKGNIMHRTLRIRCDSKTVEVLAYNGEYTILFLTFCNDFLR